MNSSPDAAMFYDAPTYTAERSIGLLMKRVMQSIKWQADRRLATHGLTDAQWIPLYKLSHHPECNTVAALARQLEMDPGATTRALDRLEAKGLLRRERSATDRRVVHVVLTDEGRRLAEVVPGVLCEVFNAHLTGFTAAEFETLLGLLQRLATNGCALRGAAASEEAA
jgi:DNA-binding MarR family transcriptional regulator